MKTKRYFRNKLEMHNVDADSLWQLEGKYMLLLNNTKRLAIYYKTHETWFYEVETLPEYCKN